ncbi:glycine-rich extracellular protein 1 isoform X3 [Mus musculus]|uniref:glycine-rich extracellular protein 1 isoform X3 n=1 Tax=Mus musculus TaxID=10090 RepID=UPI0007EC9489|nr:glycine rich extracellular protein 1 isoform X3 [Mus musculus]|eukprot:XP_017173237.1 PREDICTED: glutenin, high molecular weight subunit DX5 isoform X3 [Mus musculus]
MGIRVSPVAFFLLCLTSESLQGGLPRLPPNLGKGYSPSSGLGTAFGGDAKPQKSGSLTQNGYGTGVGGGMEPPKPGFGGKVKPQKSGYGPGLGAGAFPGVGGAQPAPAPQNGYGPGTGEGMKAPKPGPPAQNGHGPGTGEGMKPPKPGFSNGNGIGAGAFPGIGAQPGFGNGNTLGSQPGPAVQNGFGADFGGVGKAQKPGLGNGNGQGAGAFLGTGAQPGLGGGLRPQKPGYEGVKPQKPGFGNGNGFGLGAQPGPPAQNGHGPGTGEGMKPPKPGFSNGNGIGAGAFPEIGAQPGFGEGRKPQKPGYGNGNGLDALPGYGPELKAQKLGLWNGRGLGIQLGYRNGLGPRAFQGQGPQPGRGNKPSQAQMVLGRGRNKVGSPYPVHLTSGLGKAGKLLKPGEVLSVSLPAPPLGIPTPNVSPTLIAFLPLRVHDREQARDPTRPGGWYETSKDRQVTLPLPYPLSSPGYNNGNGMAAQPGPCHRGLSPAKFLPRPPTTVPSAKGGGWSLKSQLPPPVQNAPTPAIQWGPKPQKAGYQPFNGYGAGAKLGFRGGLKLQKVGFHYGNEAVDAGILPETLQPGFPRANGFRNGLREETLLYPKATVPALERHGQAGAFQPWGAGMKPGYGYAGLGIQAGPYGQLKPEQLKHLGDPEVKTYTNSQLGNGYRGHCPSGKC